MSSQIVLPDSIGINEVRLDKAELADTPIRKCYFAPSKRRVLDGVCWSQGYVPVYSGANCVYLMKTRKNAGSIPDQVNINAKKEINTFKDLPDEISRRYIFALIERVADAHDLYKGDGWQIFSLNTKFDYCHYSVNIDIREEEAYYSIFLNPASLVLIPITEMPLSSLLQGRSLMKIVEQSQHDIIEKFGHSTYPSWAGYLFKIKRGSSKKERVAGNDIVAVKPRQNSNKSIEYPALALRVFANREEISSLNLPQRDRRKLQPLSQNRLNETEDWAKRLFQDNTLKINDREFEVQNKIGRLKESVRYRRDETQDSNQLWYPSVPLLFDSLGTKTNFSPQRGLGQYGPLDQGSDSRPFVEIKPYVITPGEPELSGAINQLITYLNQGYEKRMRTDTGDTAFPGISDTFKVDFVPPNSQDQVILDEGTLTEYKGAAKRILQHWATEDKNPKRIAIVVVPDKYDKDVSAKDDPYIPIKKLFVEEGLPSQMLEVSSLLKINESSFGFGYLLWNFALNLYSKLGGKPWGLAQQINDVHCLVGLGFGISPENSLYLGIANIFDQNGQWLSFASEDRGLSEEDKASIRNNEFQVAGTSSYKLHRELTHSVLNDSLATYRISSPAGLATRVALHKNGRIYEPEALGFLQSLSSNILDGSSKLSEARFAMVSIIKNHELRLYGPPYDQLSWPMRNTVTKGSVQLLNKNSALVATTGKNRFYYPGIGTPKPLLIERYVPSQNVFHKSGFSQEQMYTIQEICEQILALTQLHWGSTRTIRLPVTSEYAQRVASFVARSQVRADTLLKLKKMWWL